VASHIRQETQIVGTRTFCVFFRGYVLSARDRVVAIDITATELAVMSNPSGLSRDIREIRVGASTACSVHAGLAQCARDVSARNISVLPASAAIEP
jgi:hypothetical protein